VSIPRRSRGSSFLPAGTAAPSPFFPPNSFFVVSSLFFSSGLADLLPWSFPFSLSQKRICDLFFSPPRRGRGFFPPFWLDGLILFFFPPSEEAGASPPLDDRRGVSFFSFFLRLRAPPFSFLSDSDPSYSPDAAMASPFFRRGGAIRVFPFFPLCFGQGHGRCFSPPPFFPLAVSLPLFPFALRTVCLFFSFTKAAHYPLRAGIFVLFFFPFLPYPSCLPVSDFSA